MTKFATLQDLKMLGKLSYGKVYIDNNSTYPSMKLPFDFLKQWLHGKFIVCSFEEAILKNCQGCKTTAIYYRDEQLNRKESISLEVKQELDKLVKQHNQFYKRGENR